jgi:hypothetical protein
MSRASATVTPVGGIAVCGENRVASVIQAIKFSTLFSAVPPM